MKAARVAVNPGEWKCVAAEFKGGNLVAFEVEMKVPEISKLHANLITAAPAMLEALKHADEATAQIVGPNEWPRKEIRAAIKAAEGGE